MGISDGTSVIPAVSQGIPIRCVFTVFAQFPNVVFSKATSGIATVADLRGRKVGIPGKFGSSWIQLEALLAGAGLATSDLSLVLFPDFGQLAALQQGDVEVADADGTNLALAHKAGHLTPRVLDRRAHLVGPVDLEQIDPINRKSPPARLIFTTEERPTCMT